MINYAHRGASEYAPENTMAAFCMGVEMGANGIETDVQRTRDGVLVLFHDATLMRTAGLDRRVCDMSWAELSAVKNGHYFVLPKDLFHLKPNDRWGEAYEKIENILSGAE